MKDVNINLLMKIYFLDEVVDVVDCVPINAKECNRALFHKHEK